MPSKDFLIHVRTCARMHSPLSVVDAPRLDSAGIDKILADPRRWLGARTVEGYDEADFAFLDGPERSRLTASVSRLKAIADQIPPSGPAEGEMVSDAKSAFRQVLEILRPDRYASTEAMELGKKIEREVEAGLPGWVREMVFETGSDATGDPALWVWVEVDDAIATGSHLLDDFQPVRATLGDAVAKISPGLWPYIRLRSSSEQRPTVRARAAR